MTQSLLTAVTRTQGATAALKEGRIHPQSCRFAFEEVPVLVHAFRRMVRDLEYDVCEMALTTYLCAKQHGAAFTALPVFLVRGFHHGAVTYNARRGPLSPQDLEGRRVGINRGYTVTTGVWARSILATEHGVDLDKVLWVLSGDEHVAEYQPPTNVVSAPQGRDLGDLLLAGELDALIGVDIDDPDVVPLIADPEEAAMRAVTGRGCYPINHLVVVRDEVLEAQPMLAADLFEAFAAAKREYVEALGADAIYRPTVSDLRYRRVLHETGRDPLPYGIEPNRAVLTELVRAAVDQHILREPVNLDAMFAGPTRHLEG